MPYGTVSVAQAAAIKGNPYLWHDRLAIFTLDVSEGHLGTLVVVDLQIRMIQIGYFLERDCFDRSVLSFTITGFQ